MQLTILYFAALREQAATEQQTLSTQATTPAELYAQLSAQHGFTLPQHKLRAAINHTFCTWDTQLNDGDIIAFIPPVSGG